jgi:hypothetical protein
VSRREVNVGPPIPEPLWFTELRRRALACEPTPEREQLLAELHWDPDYGYSSIAPAIARGRVETIVRADTERAERDRRASLPPVQRKVPKPIPRLVIHRSRLAALPRDTARAELEAALDQIEAAEVAWEWNAAWSAFGHSESEIDRRVALLEDRADPQRQAERAARRAEILARRTVIRGRR